MCSSNVTSCSLKSSIALKMWNWTSFESNHRVEIVHSMRYSGVRITYLLSSPCSLAPAWLMNHSALHQALTLPLLPHLSVLSQLKLKHCWCPSCGSERFMEMQADKLKKKTHTQRACIVKACSSQWAVRSWPWISFVNMMDRHHRDTKPLPWFRSLA